MPRTITVGLDGSPESRAAAEWAAREATLRGLPVTLVQVWEPVPEPMAQAPLRGVEAYRHWTEKILREAAEGLRLRHPGIDVTTEQLSGRPAEALVTAAKDADLLVLGSRGLGGIGGFLVGSVGLAVVAHTERPVVLVRAGEQAADGHESDRAGSLAAAAPFRPVLLGLDTADPDAAPIEFAFDAAARREVPLRVVHGWNPPYYYAYGMAADPEVTETVARSDAAALDEVLSPWRQKYPDVEVITESRCGSPSLLLTDASREAGLLVVGRRVRRSGVGAHIGTVTHAVLHHATAPVAVVSHG
ncbi:stress-inducible protein [Streptomyces sp. IMTB 2501]|uniref:universal stress protein n=1 Tax=Streptomyces sp. IMTB 2501 TaxID=1776340 RepID=UPI00096E1556|nr:universal stress protein [Streptomyces sp. IMTB 2501]OLZ69055.1 stress-inducible protein [Streptomyces sp. IMTB 2501]